MKNKAIHRSKFETKGAKKAIKKIARRQGKKACKGTLPKPSAAASAP